MKKIYERNKTFLYLLLIAVRTFVSKEEGIDEEKMAHSEDKHENDVEAKKGKYCN